MSTQPSHADAEAALSEIDAARRAVTAAHQRGLPSMLAACSALVVIDYAAKDHIGSRTVQRGVSALCAAATLGVGLLDDRSRPVQPVAVAPARTGIGAVAPLAAALAGWVVAERLVVRGLRRSRLRHPNTAAGAILAMTRPVGWRLLLRLTPQPSAT